MVFIHGRGRGILREELRKMLAEEYPHIEYFDGNYMRYGSGATEIIIHGLGKA
jgi:dsDNA-specific endonuclease/ATPase MutS2